MHRDAADAAFADRQAEVEAEPDSWRGWYRLALAYDDAGDRPRARQMARGRFAANLSWFSICIQETIHMAVKLRLTRIGKKKQPQYRIVAADARSPRICETGPGRSFV